MQDRTLIELTEVTDDDTGIWKQGEIEYGISGNLEEYLKDYGEEGKKEVVKMLETLKGVVEEYWQRVEKDRVVKSLKEDAKE